MKQSSAGLRYTCSDQLKERSGVLLRPRHAMALVITETVDPRA